jgi:Zn-dependent protease
MGSSLRIARIAGIDIKLHVTFVLVLVLAAFQWGGLGPRGALFGVVATLLVFLSVTLHELGHSVVAKAFGVPVKDITLTPLGGIAQLGGRPRTAGQELLIALAGPAVNVVLAVGLALVAVPHYGWGPLQEAFALQRTVMPTAVTLWSLLLFANVMLALFNLLPALPMDGGRVLRAVLTWVVGLEKATRWAAMVARVLAVGFVGLGLATGAPMLAFIGLFVFLMAGAEVRAVEGERMLRGVLARDAVNPFAPRFLPGTTLGEALRALVFTPFPAFAVEHFGRLVGVVTREALALAAQEVGPGGYVAGAMQRQVPTVGAGEALEEARLKMNAAGSPYVAVVDGDAFLGLITESELAQHAALGHAFKAPSRPGPRDVREW